MAEQLLACEERLYSRTYLVSQSDSSERGAMLVWTVNNWLWRRPPTTILHTVPSLPQRQQ